MLAVNLGSEWPCMQIAWLSSDLFLEGFFFIRMARDEMA